jgi:hypothetical protein
LPQKAQKAQKRNYLAAKAFDRIPFLDRRVEAPNLKQIFYRTCKVMPSFIRRGTAVVVSSDGWLRVLVDNASDPQFLLDKR